MWIYISIFKKSFLFVICKIENKNYLNYLYICNFLVFCMVNNGGCEYICIVDIGKKKCCCGFGYIFKLDGFNCLSSKGD